jgi:PIN domain nuclease of toxin-antitoxin system
MRKYLLDTHVLIWSIVDDDRLSDKVSEIIRDRDNDLFVSAVSLWEISLKFSIGKLDLKSFSLKEMTQYCNRLRITQIPLLSEEATGFSTLKIFNNHRDPFDRMLIWQAISNGYTLISKDVLFEQYKEQGLKLLW